MLRLSIILISCICLLSLTVSLKGSEGDSLEEQVSSSESKVVIDVYPNLKVGVLSYATISELPGGTILTSGEINVTEEDIEKEKAKVVKELQEQITKHGIFLLEQIITEKLIIAEAKRTLTEENSRITTNNELTSEVTATNDQTIIQLYLKSLSQNVEVDDESIVQYYQENKELFGETALRDISAQIRQVLFQQRFQKVIDEQTRTIGQRIEIQISESWLEENAALSQDNPIGIARANGRVSLVDFGSDDCEPCLKLAPVLEALKEKYKDKYDVIIIDANKEPILATIYGITAVPTQFFFDKTGKEVLRHEGFWEQERIESKLTEIDAD